MLKNFYRLIYVCLLLASVSTLTACGEADKKTSNLSGKGSEIATHETNDDEQSQESQESNDDVVDSGKNFAQDSDEDSDQETDD
jgi:hypothetical protein